MRCFLKQERRGERGCKIQPLAVHPSPPTSHPRSESTLQGQGSVATAPHFLLQWEDPNAFPVESENWGPWARLLKQNKGTVS